MQTSLRLWFVVTILNFSFFGFAGEEAGSRLFEKSFHHLFSIHRSTNKNEIIYEARTTPEGFDIENPLRAFWIMKAEDGHTEPLTSLEKSWAYGVLVKKVTEREIVFSLKALPDRMITVYRNGNEIFPTMTVNGEDAVIEDVFIQTKGGGLFPSIDYIEIKGRHRETGKTITERISGFHP